MKIALKLKRLWLFKCICLNWRRFLNLKNIENISWISWTHVYLQAFTIQLLQSLFLKYIPKTETYTTARFMCLLYAIFKKLLVLKYFLKNNSYRDFQQFFQTNFKSIDSCYLYNNFNEILIVYKKIWPQNYTKQSLTN